MFANVMSDLLPTIFLVLCFITLLLSPWTPLNTRSTQVLAALFLMASVLSATLMGKVDAWVLVPLGGLFGVAWLAAHAGSALQRVGAIVATIVLALGLATHQVPGFYSQAWFENVAFSEQARPFTLIAHWDKPWVGAILMLAFSPLSKGDITVKHSALWAVSAAVFLILIGVLAGVPVEPKWQAATGVFLLHNLFFTCMAEEAFFRLLIQAPLHEAFKRWRWGPGVVIVAVSLLFGAVHFHPQVPVMVLAIIGIGGAVYAGVFFVTRALHWAILTHFLANALHILLLRYPLA